MRGGFCWVMSDIYIRAEDTASARRDDRGNELRKVGGWFGVRGSMGYI